MANTTINVAVRGKHAECTERASIVRGNSNYIVHFDLDEEWKEHTYRTAVFSYRREGQDYVQKTLFTGNECEIPTMYWDTSVLSIGLTAGDVITSTPAMICLEDSITDMNPVNDEPPEDVYNQIMEHIKDGRLRGQSAYEVAVDEGYSGTKAEWLESLKGSPVISADPSTEAVPDYVAAEVNRVAELVRQHQTPDTMTIMAVSDPHQCAPGESGWYANITAGNKHCGMAMDLMRRRLNIDLTLMLGDYVSGSSATTIEQGRTSYQELLACFGSAFSGGRLLTTTGNHDHLSYSTAATGAHLTDAQLYPYIGSFNGWAQLPAANREAGYCYQDFERYRIRVIMLNMNDLTDGHSIGSSGTEVEHVSEAQREWLCKTLLDVNAKSDASEWGILICSHEPADCGYFYGAIGSILIAYSEKASVTVNSGSYSFSGVSAKLLAQLHGHLHNYKVDRIRKIVNGVTTPSDVTRICIPNSCFYRNNEYGQNSDSEYLDIEYGETVTYDKTANTAQDTAFCVLVIDKAASKVYAVHYGAGYDREIDISSGAESTYSVTQALTGCSSSFSGTSVSKNAAFSAEYTVQSGYENLTVTVSMGGTDITSSAVTGNSVSVPSVTGDIVVTAAASEILNLVPSSTDSEGGIYNGTGYKDGYRLNSSGAEAALSGFAVTGFIPFTKGQTIRVGGSGITFSEYGSMLYFYDGSKTAVAQTGIDYNQIGKSEYGVWVTDEANSVVCLTPSANYPSSGSESGYFRVSAKGSGAKLVVTLDKEIE